MDHGSGDQRERRLRTKLTRLRATLASATLAALVLAACSPERERSELPVVAVSVAPQAFVVERIAGSLVDVTVMLPPGANAHAYEPTLKELRAVSDATLYVKVGHPKFTFEHTWLDALLRDRPGLIVVDSSAGVETDADDPHVWISPALVREMARNVEAALARMLPGHRDTLEANLAAFLAGVDRVDTDLRNTFEPHQRKRFFVFHPAWGYFAREYGLVQVAIEREGHEPDPRSLARVIDEARAARVKVIFVQPQHNDASARLVAGEIGARIDTLDPLARDLFTNLRQAAAKISEGLVD